jgi:hypothetical protein
MVKIKTPVDPPDTLYYDEDSSTGHDSEPSEHNSAGSSESEGSKSGNYEVPTYSVAPEPRIHPVMVTVFKDGNGSRFLSNLLIHLQQVDGSAKILPHPEAPSRYVPLQSTKVFPMTNRRNGSSTRTSLTLRSRRAET